jgi:hypothetical protein
MIRTPLLRFYSSVRKPAVKKANPFPLARPLPPRPAPTPLPEKTAIEKEFTILEAARFTLSPSRFLKKPNKDNNTPEYMRSQVQEFRDTKARDTKGHLRYYLFLWTNIVLFSHLFTTHVYELNGTLGASMLPTIYFEGDWVLINKLCRRGKGIQVGDLVSARHPLKPEELIIKRITAMPGDFVLADTVETSGRMIQV